MPEASAQASRIRAAWREIAPNFDQALADHAARTFLVQLNAEGFEQGIWRVALRERMDEFPEFFRRFDYEWCADQECFDFPVEAAYQVRAINAALGFWLASPDDRPESLNLGRIVARTTYLARFDDATPHVKTNRELDFLISPLGWIEFLHRLFAAFAAAWSPDQSFVPNWRAACLPQWHGILVNLVACSVNDVDYVLPSMVDRVVGEVPFFSEALSKLRAADETNVSRDLADAAQEFAICHELAHIVSGDHEGSPDELRADRWGLAAYWRSWPLQMARHFEIGRSDRLRAALGPIAFACALRCVLAARVHVLHRLGVDRRKLENRTAVFDGAVRRSRALLGYLDTLVGDPSGPQAAAFAAERTSLSEFVRALADYEMAFGEVLRGLPADACIAAKLVARQAHNEATGTRA